MTLSPRFALIAAGIAIVMAGCTTPMSTKSSPSATGKQAGGMSAMARSTATSGTVALAAASGSLVSGTLKLTPVSDGVRIVGEIGGLAPNSTHGFHIHETGDCSAADAKSAGGHFNPASMPHGRAGAGPHHAGDMDNIVSNAQGVARVDVVDRSVTLGGGAANDADGRAFIVHGGADDYTSQPSGDAGSRVACGVIKAKM